MIFSDPSGTRTYIEPASVGRLLDLRSIRVRREYVRSTSRHLDYLSTLSIYAVRCDVPDFRQQSIVFYDGRNLTGRAVGPTPVDPIFRKPKVGGEADAIVKAACAQR